MLWDLWFLFVIFRDLPFEHRFWSHPSQGIITSIKFLHFKLREKEDKSWCRHRFLIAYLEHSRDPFLHIRIVGFKNGRIAQVSRHQSTCGVED